MLQKSEQMARNEHAIDYDDRQAFTLDCQSLTPIYKVRTNKNGYTSLVFVCLLFGKGVHGSEQRAASYIIWIGVWIEGRCDVFKKRAHIH